MAASMTKEKQDEILILAQKYESLNPEVRSTTEAKLNVVAGESMAYYRGLFETASASSPANEELKACAAYYIRDHMQLLQRAAEGWAMLYGG